MYFICCFNRVQNEAKRAVSYIRGPWVTYSHPKWSRDSRRQQEVASLLRGLAGVPVDFNLEVKILNKDNVIRTP